MREQDVGLFQKRQGALGIRSVHVVAGQGEIGEGIVRIDLECPLVQRECPRRP